jgi:peroxiredoxin
MKIINSAKVRPYTSILLATIVLALFLAGSFVKAAGKNSSTKTFARVGEKAPDFTLQDFQGKKFTLSKLTRNKSVLLWFTNLCEGCQSKIPDVLKIKADYEKKGLEVVAVSVLGEDRQFVEDAVKVKKISYRFLYDPKGDAIERFCGRYVQGTCPLKSMYVIKKGGVVTFATHLPGVPVETLRAEIDKAVQ